MKADLLGREHVCHTAQVSVQARGQLVEVVFSFPLYIDSKVPTQVFRLLLKAPVLAEQSHQPLVKEVG